MIISKLKKIREIAKLKRIAIFVLTFVITYSILTTSLITKKYSLNVGEIAKADIKATREIIDEISTQGRIKQAEEAVPLQFNKKTEVKYQILDNIRNFFVRLSSIKELNMEEKDKLKNLKAETSITLNDNDYLALIKISLEEQKILQSSLVAAINDLYENNNINEDKSEEITRAQELLAGKINSFDISKNNKDLAKNIANTQIKPNFFYDKEKTEELRKNAVKNVSPIVIKKDQTIVKEGEPVTENQIEILKDLGLLNNNKWLEWYIYVGMGILIFTIILLQWFYLYKYYRYIFDDYGKLVLISILNCIALLLARTISLISPYLIPLACIPMLLNLLINYKISITISIINTLLISGIVDFNIEITLLAVLNAVLGAMILRKMQARNDILYSSLYISIINVIVTFSIGVLLSNNLLGVLQRSLLSGVGGLITAVLTIGLLPFFESTFDIVTIIKLLELSNSNHPLLKKLLLEAPGTYHHSILVANLAEVAAEEVGGNPVLARVGAYYHDIGKIKRPYFFKENQMGGDNPHNKISPNMSTAIITSHVRDGIELAKEAKIPKVIQDIIEQHHGNSLVKYFYLTMKNSSSSPEEINEENFRYNGTIPKSKEAGIIMLADSVEAAVRSINDPTKIKIEEMVNNIVKDRLSDGQLDDCDLTLRDIEKIRKAFLKALTGIYHQRIEYPSDKNEGKKI